MKTITTFVFAFLTMTTISAQSKKELKEQEQEENYSKTKQLVESGNYYFKATNAQSQRGVTRDVRSDSYDLKIEGDKAEGYFIFFGQSQMPGYGGSGDGAIEFTNENITFKTEYVDEKHKIIVKFKANNDSENYNVSLTVLSNGRSTLYIQSDRRDSMSYNGVTTKIK